MINHKNQFIRIHSKIKIIAIVFILILLQLVINSCWGSKDVNCMARLHLTVINNMSDTTVVKLGDISNKEAQINIYQPTLKIAANDTAVDSIDYKWIGNHECSLSNLFKDNYTINAEITSKGQQKRTIQIYPWDTTQYYTDICTGCLHIYNDTIFTLE